jgi:hypothetical protein
VSRGVEFTATVESGRLPQAVGRQIAALLRTLDGKQVVISLRERKRRRSLNQNDYFHGVVLPIVWQFFREHGNDVDLEETKTYLKEHVGKLFRLVLVDGKRMPVLRSTASLSVQEWEVWMEQIRAWGAGVGCNIPLPNEPANYLEIL